MPRIIEECEVDSDIRSTYSKLAKEHTSYLSPFYGNRLWDPVKEMNLEQEKTDFASNKNGKWKEGYFKLKTGKKMI
eukprot:snap_masked-scaffold_27-processed-gene-4.34-mRNA-1 protein AED:1.00 eAED:1.00 QI:0/-1/0/0/-1/1/1/0/75